MEFSEMRRELIEKGYSKEDIKLLISSINDIVLEEELNYTYDQKTLAFRLIGLVMILTGLFFTIATLFDIIRIPGYYLIIPIGMLLSGFTMFLTSKLVKSDKKSKFGRFRR